MLVQKILNKVVFLSICVLSTSLLNGQFAGGSGTESDPWLIQTRTQLEMLSNYLGAEHTNKHFRQTANIDLGQSLRL